VPALTQRVREARSHEHTRELSPLMSSHKVP
jgi:hypothetical protein